MGCKFIGGRVFWHIGINIGYRNKHPDLSLR